MRLTSKTRIAVRALYDMAFHCRGGQAQAKEIAVRQQIHVRTLEQVLQELRKAGLIAAQRGPRGGYRLARNPAEINVSEIVRAVEGPVERLLAFQDDAAADRQRPRRLRSSARPNDATKGNGNGNGNGTGAATETSASTHGADVPELIWGDIAGRIAVVLGQTTLADFVARAEKAAVHRDIRDSQIMYVI